VKPRGVSITRQADGPFSILERIDVGETLLERSEQQRREALSVSSNGSTWVKLMQ